MSEAHGLGTAVKVGLRYFYWLIEQKAMLSQRPVSDEQNSLANLPCGCECHLYNIVLIVSK